MLRGRVECVCLGVFQTDVDVSVRLFALMERSRRKLLPALGAVLILVGCASIGPPLPPSLELPAPPSDLRATRKGDKVTLAWTVPSRTTDRQRVRNLGPTRICRGLGPTLKQCGAAVGEMTVPNAQGKSGAEKNSAAYVDTIPPQMESEHPLDFATYAIEVLNAGGRGAGLSNQVRVSLAPTLPPPQNFTVEVTAQGVGLRWAENSLPASEPGLHYRYRVYRRSEGSQREILVGELPLAANSDMRLTDANIEWEQTYQYRANVTTIVPVQEQSGQEKTEVHVEGDDTPEVKVFAHDIFPPAVPGGLQAVYSGPGQPPFIDLIWAPVADMDFAGYNVYRHERDTPPVKINAELIKTPAYRDADVQPGKTYFYSVSAVDMRGNESAHSEEASENVP
jgi:hypothetical protein